MAKEQQSSSKARRNNKVCRIKEHRSSKAKEQQEGNAKAKEQQGNKNSKGCRSIEGMQQ